MSRAFLNLITALFGGAKPVAASAPIIPATPPASSIPTVAIGDDLFLGRFPRATTWRGIKGVNSRSWRNRNPGNMRLRTTKPPVDPIAIDNDPSGPYGIYATECEGWADLAARVIQLWDGGTRTIGPLKADPKTEREKGIIWVWAPPKDKNNTNAYIDAVCKALKVAPTQPIPDPRDMPIMLVIADTVRRVEGLPADPPWDAEQRDAGLRLAGCR